MGPGHDANLAEFIDDDELKIMATEMITDFRQTVSLVLIGLEHTSRVLTY